LNRVGQGIATDSRVRLTLVAEGSRGPGGPPHDDGEDDYAWVYERDQDSDTVERFYAVNSANPPTPTLGTTFDTGPTGPTPPTRPAGSPPPPTRVEPIRIQPEPPQPRPAAGAYPGGPGGGPGGGAGGGPGGGMRMPRPHLPHPFRWMRRVRLLIAVVLLLLIAWPVSLLWVGLHTWHDVRQVAWEPGGHRPADQPGNTYLLVGSDSRAGLTKKQRHRLHTGNAVGQRTDTIKLLHTGDGPALLMTIPRDSYVEIPGHGTSKINAAFAWGGPQLLVQTIEQNTGIRIDGYLETGFGGLVKAVNAVGGITICPTENIDEPLSGLHVKKGCQTANGATALAFARDRHSFALGDIQRGIDQNEVITQVAHKAFKPGTLLNPFKLHSLGSALDKTITVGKGMSAVRALKLFLGMKAATGGSTGKAWPGKGMTCTVPLANMDVQWDPNRSQQFFGYVIKDDTGDIPKRLCTASGLPN
jgi:LCP family protein required for cell wall assembly